MNWAAWKVQKGEVKQHKLVERLERYKKPELEQHAKKHKSGGLKRLKTKPKRPSLGGPEGRIKGKQQAKALNQPD